MLIANICELEIKVKESNFLHQHHY